MIFPARPRSAITRVGVPMAVPLDGAGPDPLGARLASSAQRLLDRARTEAVRRIILWLLVTLCIGALALGYLLQTSKVASLANERATFEREIATMRDKNARLAAQAAGYQTLSRADATARDQGLRAPPAASIVYVALPDVVDAPPPATAAPTAAPGLIRRIRDALAGRAAANNGAVLPTPQAVRP